MPLRRPDRERDIEAFFVKEAKKLGMLPIKFTSPVQRSLPDRLVLLPKGGVRFIEFKAPGAKPTPAQAALHETFRALGHPVDVIDSREGVVDWLAKAIRSTDLLGS